VELNKLTGKAELDVRRDNRKGPFGSALLVNELVAEEDIFTTWELVSVETIVVLGDKRVNEVATNDPQIMLDVHPDELAHLNQDGMAKVGTLLKEGDIIIATARKTKRLTPEERIFRSIFGNPEKGFWRSYAQRWPYLEPGLVIEAKKFLGEAGRRVTIAIRRPICEGDILEELSSKRRFVVAQVTPLGEPDILTGPEGLDTGTYKLKKLHQTLQDKLIARASGPYSIIDQMPLAVGPRRGQLLKKEEVALLYRADQKALLKECLSLRSGAFVARVKTWKAIAEGKDFEISGVPELIYRAVYLLRGLGFNPVLLDEKGAEISFPQGDDLDAKLEGIFGLRIKLATQEDILGWSSGQVRYSDTIDYRSRKPAKEGLFCERIFGPEYNYECSCGKYLGRKYEGVVCDKCGVEVTSSDTRMRRMGHIMLPKPMVNPLLLEPIAQMLGREAEEIEDLAFYDSALIVKPGESSFQEGEIIPLELAGGAQKILYGSDAIRWLMEKAGVETKGFFLEAIAVIPPNFRPILRLQEGRFATADINDLYRRLINRANRAIKFKEIGAAQVIQRNEERMVLEAIQSLFANRTRKYPVLGKKNRPLIGLDEVLERCLAKLFQRRIDYSGSGVVVPDDELKLRHIGLPAWFAGELLKPFLAQAFKQEAKEKFLGLDEILSRIKKHDPEALRILSRLAKKFLVAVICRKERSPVMAVLRIIVKPRLSEALALHPRTAQALGINFRGERIKLYLPVSKQAQEQAKEFLYPRTIPQHPTSPIPHMVGEEWELGSSLALLHPKNIGELALSGQVLALSELDQMALGVS
jgi:hypothetical protein